MNIMKKTNKVYSVNDFRGFNNSILVEETKWYIDSIDCTAVGEYSGLPLFEVGFKRCCDDNADPNDATAELEPNRTYFVREGRPLFNVLANIWEDTEDIRAVCDYVMDNYNGKYFRGRVERLSGVQYQFCTRRGNVVQRSKMEMWYPATVEEGVIVDDFLYLCNKGVFQPILVEAEDPIKKAIESIDPAVIAAIRTMK